MAGRQNISRREALRISAASALAAAASPAALAQPPAAIARGRGGGRPRNIIFMVADGMSPGVPAMAEAFSRIIRAGGAGTNWRALAARDDVVRGFFDMTSLNSLVTDSAAAASAWGSGSRIFNWALNTLPDGRELVPIAPLARQRDRSVGLITTTRLTHATPAGFAAAVPNRDLEADIAPQYLQRVDVLLGGGREHFDPARRHDRRDLFADFGAAGFTVVHSRDDLLALPEGAERVLGVFSTDHLPYSLDAAGTPSIRTQTPTLAEMMRSALARLARIGDGFLLQVEGGRVDHAAHDNDAASMLHDQLAFDDAIGVALEFAREHPDTLIVITTDHGTGNPGLSGVGSRYQRSNAAFEKLAAAASSFQHMHARLTQPGDAGQPPTGADVARVVREGTGVALRDDEIRTLTNVVVRRAPPEPQEISLFQASIAGLLGQMIGNHTGVTFGTVAHTSDWALTMALGPGAERFEGLHPCTHAFEVMAEFLGIEHRNPRMSDDEAKRFAAAAPSRDRYA